MMDDIKTDTELEMDLQSKAEGAGKRFPFFI